MRRDLGGNREKTLIHDCGGAGNGDTNSWCCAGVEGVTGQGTDCCSSNASTFSGPFPYSTVTVIKAVPRSLVAMSSSVSSRTSLSSSSSAIASSSASLEPSSTEPTTKGTPLPASASVTSATAASSSNSKSSQSHPTSHATAIGAAIGVPIGVLLMAFLLYLLHRERRTKKQIHDLQAHMQNRERQSSEHNLPTPEYQDVSKPPVPQNYELDTGIDRGELTAGYNVHEAAGRGRSEI